MENTINFDIQKPQTNYQTIIGNNIFDNFGNILKEKINCKKLLIITDDNVNELYGNKMKEVLDKNDAGNYNIPKIVFDVDELVGSENLSKIKTFSVDITQGLYYQQHFYNTVTGELEEVSYL